MRCPVTRVTASFIPTNDAATVGWYAPDSIVSSGGLVSQWTDKTAFGNHFLGSGAAKPATTANLLNGFGGFTTNGTSTNLSIASFNFNSGTEMSVFIVCRLKSDTPGIPMIFSLASGSAEIREQSSKITFVRNAGTIAGPASIAGSFVILEAIWRGTGAGAAFQGWLHGVSQGTGTGTYNIGNGQVDLGVRSGANWSNTDYLELIICNADIGNTRRAAMESYLATKYPSVA